MSLTGVLLLIALNCVIIGAIAAILQFAYNTRTIAKVFTVLTIVFLTSAMMAAHLEQEEFLNGPPTHSGRITEIRHIDNEYTQVSLSTGEELKLETNNMVEELVEGASYNLWIRNNNYLAKYEVI